MAGDKVRDDSATCDPTTGEPCVNRGELARAFKITEPTVDRWVADGCPCVERGANGRPYKFLVSQVRAWLADRLGREEAETATRLETIRQQQLDLAGGRPGDSPMAMGPRERFVLWQEELTYEKAARERGELIPAQLFRDALTQLFRSIRAFSHAFADRLGRQCGLNTAVIAAIQSAAGGYQEQLAGDLKQILRRILADVERSSEG